MFTGPVGPVKGCFFCPEAVLGNFTNLGPAVHCKCRAQNFCTCRFSRFQTLLHFCVSKIYSSAFCYHKMYFKNLLHCILLSQNVFQKSTQLHSAITKCISKIYSTAFCYHKMYFKNLLNCILLSQNVFQKSTQLHSAITKCISKIYSTAFCYHKMYFKNLLNCILLSQNVFQKSAQLHSFLPLVYVVSQKPKQLGLV